MESRQKCESEHKNKEGRRRKSVGETEGEEF